MVQQVIHKNNMLYNADDYAMVFDVTKIEIVNFLESLPKDELDDLDLLGDWIETFDTFFLSIFEKKFFKFCII
jgi:hypothetical protein